MKKRKIVGVVFIVVGLIGLVVLGCANHKDTGTSPGVTMEASGVVTADSTCIGNETLQTCFEE